MFGQHDDQYQQSQGNQGQAPAADDGSVAMPTDSSVMAGVSNLAPATTTDQDMPGFEPTGSGDASTDSPANHHLSANTPEELISIKQEALQSLKPLVGHLEQSAEEKFRTTMMMIQASDDQSLIPEAYEAAKSIEDEKKRAQALLDVVNEINYFTTQNTQQTQQQ